MFDAEVAVATPNRFAQRLLHDRASLWGHGQPLGGHARDGGRTRAAVPRAQPLDLAPRVLERYPDGTESLDDRPAIVPKKPQEKMLRAHDRRPQGHGLLARVLNGLTGLPGDDEALSIAPVSRHLGKPGCDALGMLLVYRLLRHAEDVGDLAPGPSSAERFLDMQRFEAVETRPKRSDGLKAFLRRMRFGCRKGELDLARAHSFDCNPVLALVNSC